MRIMIILFIFLFSNQNFKKTNETFTPLESDFPIHWKVKMGKASFRSNVTFTDRSIVIGSNGDSFMDMGIYDKSSGVYVLDRKTGKIIKHFANENLGDMDVNGVLIFNKKYYFGNDNEEFLCTDLDGNIIWRNPTSGDIEHEPLLLNVKGKNMIVYASETGEVRAVDPATGNKLWVYYTPDFSGYKTGDNRLFFKVKSYFSNTQSFFQKPHLADLDKDGVADLVYHTYDNKIIAINGLNGKLLWDYKPDFSLTLNMIMSNDTQNPLFTVCGRDYDRNTQKTNCFFVSIDRNGKLIEKRMLEQDYYEYSLNNINIAGDTSVVNVGDTLFFIHNGKVKRAVGIYSNNSKDSLADNFRKDPLFGTATFSYDDHPRCIILLRQSYNYEKEENIVDILSLDDGEVIKRYLVANNSEMPPQVLDVNKDGFLDLLISSYDDYLYCYDMKIKTN